MLGLATALGAARGAARVTGHSNEVVEVVHVAFGVVLTVSLIAQVFVFTVGCAVCSMFLGHELGKDTIWIAVLNGSARSTGVSEGALGLYVSLTMLCM